LNRKEYEQALAEWEEAMVKYEADMKLWEQQDYYYKERCEEYQKRGVPMPWYLDTPPGPPPVKPTPPTRSPFRKFLDGYIIFSGFTFLAICFCVFAFLMWWLIGILSGSYFMAWLTVILMAAAIPITIHYGMKK